MIKIRLKICADIDLRICDDEDGKAVDMNIVFEPTAPTQSPVSMKGTTMATSNKKASGPGIKCKMVAKGKLGAVMPDVTLTDPLPALITLQPIDASGNVVVLTPADTVQGTLTSSSANLVVTQAADSLHFTGTIPANTPQGSTTDLVATLQGTIQGAAADLAASVHVIINLPPNPVAVDLNIIFG